MANITPFETLTSHYDAWFEEHSEVYQAELDAIRSVIPPFERGVEIGVGTGRFAKPLGIREGVEPSPKMAAIAKKRGIDIIPGEAEKLPLPDAAYDLVLMVTTICFVDDVLRSLREIHRILKPGGTVIVGFVDKETPLGRKYQQHKEQSRFYKTAHFFSSKEVLGYLKEAEFTGCEAIQTLFGEDLQSMRGGIEPGYGKGAFVVIRCNKEVS